jgi:L-lactate dehydrogenase (cytochrome)
LSPIVEKYKGKIKIMMDSGIQSGPDIARTLAAGADFTFLGRSFMYSVAALGEKGGDHMMGMLKTQLHQVMDQVCCKGVCDLPNHLVK